MMLNKTRPDHTRLDTIILNMVRVTVCVWLPSAYLHLDYHINYIAHNSILSPSLPPLSHKVHVYIAIYYNIIVLLTHFVDGNGSLIPNRCQ